MMKWNVILSEAKDLTVGMLAYSCQLNVSEAMKIRGSLKISSADERSLASLGMTKESI
jgi:hypothetical protein